MKLIFFYSELESTHTGLSVIDIDLPRRTAKTVPAINEALEPIRNEFKYDKYSIC